ncbi:MAG: flagellar hook-associated protein FlgK [SAR86 cluster bacterium]|uniref:Flagellar hook-associated protein 1 n=1 Tax=SAR86 cluster bacterium TaxID=2030880 RepID=A0A2A4XHY7_9GAMM|nr:MAG: flagellar hook-associated protein FlgK [SAR86 cluster bacterium]
MPDLLKVAANSLQSWQQALNTTGHNIANANTEGYSRQSVQFETADPRVFGFGFVGQGSKVSGIERSHNEFLSSQVQELTSSSARYQVFTEFSSRVDDVLAGSENNLNSSIQKFFNAVSEVAGSPGSLPERQVLLGEASNLVDRQQSYHRLLQDLNEEVNSRIRSGVNEINNLSDSIGAINKQITSAIASSNGATPNDLLDQRDRLIEQLSRKVTITTVDQNDGSLNVLVGKGQPLVIGSQITHLDTRFSATDSTRIEVTVPGQVAASDSSQLIGGGELQGVIDFRSRILNPALDKLGLIALGISETVNEHHLKGIDLNGDMGNNFFNSTTVPIAGDTRNIGTTTPSVVINDVTQIRASDYTLAYDGSQWQLTRMADNTSVSGTGPLVLDGLSVDVSSGVPVAGDSFVLNAARTAASTFSLAISDPRKIAAANPLLTNSTLSNAGSAQLQNLTVASANSLPLAGPITLTYNPDALGAGIPGYDVSGGPGGTLAYAPTTESLGKSFSFAGIGIDFELSGIPQNGDSFTIGNNSSAVGDNRNMQSIAELQFQSKLNGGNDSFQDFYSSLVAQVGVISNQANANYEIETSLLQQATSYRDNVIGVNLDEEAANLLRFQQAYQASAQLVKVADDMFQILINSIR